MQSEFDLQILFKIFVCVHEKYWLVNFFLVMSLSGFGIRVLVTSLRFGNCSPFFCSLKDCIWFLEFCTCLILFPSLYYLGFDCCLFLVTADGSLYH